MSKAKSKPKRDTMKEAAERLRPYTQVREVFDREALKRICEMHETEFADAYDMEVVVCEEQDPRDDYPNFYAFKDNGSSILAVAHLDTVVNHYERTANFVDTEAGPVIFSGSLDDRLGAYTILELLPALGIKVDVLLTTGEESGNSSGQFFDAPEDRDYHWMIEFDRGGTDVVMYQYEDDDLERLVRRSGAKVGDGIFSDISYMDHLEIKGINWGVGYQEYHGPRAHAFLEDYWTMLGHYVKFHEANHATYLPHEDNGMGYGYRSRRSQSSSSLDDWDDARWDAYLKDVRDREDDDIIDLGPLDGQEFGEYVDLNEIVSEDFETVNNSIMSEQEGAA